MSLPVISGAGPALDRIYRALPEHYRVADAAAAGDYPLYRWLAGVSSIQSTLEALVASFDYDDSIPGSTSQLVDPEVAPVDWLPWLAQLVGVPLTNDLSEAEKRDAITFASAGWRAGTKTAMAAAAKTALTGTRYAQVFDHSVSDPGDGDQWDVLIVTRSTETADDAAVLDAVVRRNAKPAGVVLHHRSYASSYTTVASVLGPTWADINGPWSAIEEAGL